jgi:hypothetical protein
MSEFRYWGRMLGMLAILGGCSQSPTEQQQDALAAAQARWRAAGVSAYSFQLQHTCFCAPVATNPVIISVQQNNVTSIAYVNDGTSADTALFRDYMTVDRLFAFLHRALSQQPDTFRATYDLQLGYPTDVYIDNNFQIADDEFGLRVSVLQR